MGNWYWEYKMTYSCDKSWKLGDNNLTEEEAKKQACNFAELAVKYCRAVETRWALDESGILIGAWCNETWLENGGKFC